MNLNTKEIYTNLENFRKKKGYSQEKMAELIGMGSKSAYNKMLKLKSMKVEYLVNLINNTEITFEQLSGESTIYELKETGVDKVEEKTTVIKTLSCLDCIEKERTIQAQKKTIEIQEKYILSLEVGHEKNERATFG